MKFETILKIKLYDDRIVMRHVVLVVYWVNGNALLVNYRNVLKLSDWDMAYEALLNTYKERNTYSYIVFENHFKKERYQPKTTNFSY